MVLLHEQSRMDRLNALGSYLSGVAKIDKNVLRGILGCLSKAFLETCQHGAVYFAIDATSDFKHAAGNYFFDRKQLSLVMG